MAVIAASAAKNNAAAAAAVAAVIFAVIAAAVSGGSRAAAAAPRHSFRQLKQRPVLLWPQRTPHQLDRWRLPGRDTQPQPADGWIGRNRHVGHARHRPARARRRKLGLKHHGACQKRVRSG
eukprot:365679-Chlamydomonas_euryale.AAC.3